MNPILLEAIAVLATVICVILSARGKVLAWPVGLVGVTAYGVVFFHTQLYMSLLLQIIFFSQGLYGWYTWRQDVKNLGQIEVRTLGRRSRFYIILILIVIYAFILGNIYDSVLTASRLPYIDVFLTLLCIWANLLLARKYLESWAMWAIVDVVYCEVFISSGLYLSAALYFGLFFLACYGFLQWKRLWTTNINTASR